MNFLITLFLVFCIPFSAKAADGTPATELIPVKIGDIVQYPLNAEPVEVKAQLNGVWHICTLMPGDSFEAIRILDYDYDDEGRSEIELQKRKGTPGNHEICPKDSFTSIDTTNCIVKRTEEGMPEGLSCNHSLKTLFNPQEESN